MSKRAKKNRRDHNPSKSQAGRRGMPRLTACFLATAVALSIGLWWWSGRSADLSAGAKQMSGAIAANPAAMASRSQFQKLIGRWQRPDGGYVLAIKTIAGNGAMDVGYFNPKRIHVGKAEASQDGEAVKAFVELSDVNYPGSSYTLVYDPATDQLNGIYYQAVAKQRYPVIFMRAQ